MYSAILAATWALAAPLTASQDPLPRDWHRTDISDSVPGATAFTQDIGGTRNVTVAFLTAPDSEAARNEIHGIVMQAQVRCDERLWWITRLTSYAADNSIVSQSGPMAEAPLVRETPLHSAVTDICDGGHTGEVFLTTIDPVEVLDRLNALLTQDDVD